MGRVASARMRLPEHFSGENASGLISEFIAKRGSDLTVDASAVEGMDTPGIEVLASAAVLWRGDKRRISYRNPSENFRHCLAALGIGVEQLESSRK